jgi:hypothetical protein
MANTLLIKGKNRFSRSFFSHFFPYQCSAFIGIYNNIYQKDCQSTILYLVLTNQINWSTEIIMCLITSALLLVREPIIYWNQYVYNLLYLLTLKNSLFIIWSWTDFFFFFCFSMWRLKITCRWTLVIKVPTFHSYHYFSHFILKPRK